MTRVIYVNGRYLPYARAAVHAEDRGFQFADAIYEVIEVKGGHLIDERRHMQRLERSLKELKMAQPMSGAALGLVVRETIRRNHVSDGLVYLQVTRGAARRDFLFPDPAVRPTLVCLARSLNTAKREARAAVGIAVKSCRDIRWGRSDIKTVMLLPASLAKNAAKEEGAEEAWFVDGEGFVTEGASSNAWIVDASGGVITHPIDTSILPGVTRATLMDLMKKEGVVITERRFSLEEALRAREAFITSASGIVMPVVSIDGHPIADGKPGALSRLLRSRFHQFAETSRF